QIAAAHREDFRPVDTGPTPAVGAGELVFAALVTDAAPGSITPGSSQGIPYTPRAQTTSGSAYEEDITSSAAGPQGKCFLMGRRATMATPAPGPRGVRAGGVGGRARWGRAAARGASVRSIAS